MNAALCTVLLSWVLHLSPYEDVEGCPGFESVSHAWLVENACEGRECKVLGWYPGGGDTVYLDDRMDLEGNNFHASIALHEIVHWVQNVKGTYDGTCESAVLSEREAYGIQSQYLVAYGEYRPVGTVLPMLRCESSDQE